VIVTARALVACLLFSGCGRLKFDDHGDGGRGGHDGDGGGLGADGPLPITCTPTGAEVCNGLDDDCNGVVDDGCPCTSISTSLSESPGLYTGELVWTGTGLIQVGGNAAEVGLWPISGTGTVGSYVSVFSGAAGSTDGIAPAAWSGTKLGIVYTHDLSSVSFALYDPMTGTSPSMLIDTSYPGAAPQIAWSVDHFIAVWITQAGEVIERQISATGSLSSETIIATNQTGGIEAFAVTPTQKLLCIRTSSGDAHLLAIDSTGGGVQTIPLAIDHGSWCGLTPIPNGFVAWTVHPSTTPAHVALLAGDGTPVSVTTLPLPSVNQYTEMVVQRVATGFWIVATHTTPALYSHAIDEIELDASGNLTSGPTEIVPTVGAYLWSPPISVVAGGLQAWGWSQNVSLDPYTYTLSQGCF
jgi:hypothetical protein